MTSPPSSIGRSPWSSPTGVPTLALPEPESKRGRRHDGRYQRISRLRPRRRSSHRGDRHDPRGDPARRRAVHDRRRRRAPQPAIPPVDEGGAWARATGHRVRADGVPGGRRQHRERAGSVSAGRSFPSTTSSCWPDSRCRSRARIARTVWQLCRSDEHSIRAVGLFARLQEPRALLAEAAGLIGSGDAEATLLGPFGCLKRLAGPRQARCWPRRIGNVNLAPVSASASPRRCARRRKVAISS